MPEPEFRFFESMRLRLNYAVWGREDRPPLILVHGKGDHCRTWDGLAAALADRFCVYALDLRGHGDSQWAQGGTYLIADYVADLARLVRVIDRGPVSLIGHSLGGRIVPYFAAAFPEFASRVITIEGFGGTLAPGGTAQRLRAYVEEMERVPTYTKRFYATLEAAAERMASEHPEFERDLVLHMTRHGVQAQPDGSLAWKFDPLLRSQPFYDSRLEDSIDVWQAVRAPMLIVAGGLGWARMTPERRSLLQGLANSRLVIVEGGGHWLHLSHQAFFLDLARDFLADGAPPGPIAEQHAGGMPIAHH